MSFVNYINNQLNVKWFVFVRFFFWLFAFRNTTYEFWSMEGRSPPTANTIQQPVPLFQHSKSSKYNWRFTGYFNLTRKPKMLLKCHVWRHKKGRMRGEVGNETPQKRDVILWRHTWHFSRILSALFLRNHPKARKFNKTDFSFAS